MSRVACLLLPLLAACAPTRWSGLSPVEAGDPRELRWAPLRPADPGDVDGVVYDLLVLDPGKGNVAYERRDLPEPRHRLEKSLGEGYHWTVRARYFRRGEPRRTSWTTIRGADRDGETTPFRGFEGVPLQN